MKKMEEVISDYDICMNSIYSRNCNLDDINFSKFTENQQNEIVSAAISIGMVEAIVRLAQTPGFDINRLPTIKKLVDEKTYYNFTHGGIGRRDAKRIEKKINSAFKDAKDAVAQAKEKEM